MTNFDNLDSFLNPIGSPYVENQGLKDASTFNATYDRGVITSPFIQNASITNAKIGTAAIGTANIGTLSFNEISGGTATLGGTSNGDGLVSVSDITGTQIVKLDNNGISITNTSPSGTAAGTSAIQYINFYRNGTAVGNIGYKKYISATDGVEVSDMIFRTLEGTSTDRDIYITNDLYTSNNGTRLSFIQHKYSTRSGSFGSAQLNYGLNGVSPSFLVNIDGTTGNGYIELIKRTSDPATGAGRMYYNTSTGKFRVCDGAGWRDMG